MHKALKSIHQKTKVINAKAVICNLLFPCQILTLWRFTACLTLITDTVAWRGKGRKDWKCSASSNSRPWVGYYLKMLLKLMLQLKTCVSDCRLTATAQNETGLKKLMLTIFPFLIHFLSPSVNDIKSGGKKRRKMWSCFFPHHHGLSKKDVTLQVSTAVKDTQRHLVWTFPFSDCKHCSINSFANVFCTHPKQCHRFRWNFQWLYTPIPLGAQQGEMLWSLRTALTAEVHGKTKCRWQPSPNLEFRGENWKS